MKHGAPYDRPGPTGTPRTGLLATKPPVIGWVSVTGRRRGAGLERLRSGLSRTNGKSGRPWVSKATSSPSSVALLGSADSSGTRGVMSQPRRLRTRSLPLCRDDRAEPVPLQFVGVVAASRQLAGAGKHRFRKGAIRRHRMAAILTPAPAGVSRCVRGILRSGRRAVGHARLTLARALRRRPAAVPLRSAPGRQRDRSARTTSVGHPDPRREKA